MNIEICVWIGWILKVSISFEIRKFCFNYFLIEAKTPNPYIVYKVSLFFHSDSFEYIEVTLFKMTKQRQQ